MLRKRESFLLAIDLLFSSIFALRSQCIVFELRYEVVYKGCLVSGISRLNHAYTASGKYTVAMSFVCIILKVQ